MTELPPATQLKGPFQCSPFIRFQHVRACLTIFCMVALIIYSFSTSSWAAGTSERGLFAAIEAGLLQDAKDALDTYVISEAPESERTQFYDSALRHAVRHNRVEIAGELLSRGAAVNHSYHLTHITPLSLAVEQGHSDMSLMLLEHGADPDSRHGFWLNISPLYLATSNGDLAMVTLLLEHKAKIRPSGWSEFWDAVKEPFELLINGITLDFSKEPSLLAAATESGNQELYRLLKTRGAR